MDKKEEVIAGAVAQGWCHKLNQHKVMDIDLALAITDEVSQVSQCNLEIGIHRPPFQKPICILTLENV